MKFFTPLEFKNISLIKNARESLSDLCIALTPSILGEN